LAFSAPCIFDISLLTTRLRTADVADGCSKVTLLSTPMENPCQSITMFCDVWFMVMSASVWFMEPLPAVMSPPVGRVEAEKAMEEKVRKKEMVRNNIDLALFFVSTHVRPMSKTCPALTNCIPIPTSTLKY